MRGKSLRNTTFEELLEQRNAFEGQIASLQAQLAEKQQLYLESSWQNGNIYIGWNTNMPTAPVPPHPPRILISPKEKMFSLSSLSSSATQQLLQSVDRQLAPYGEHRFESKKKSKKLKKRNASQMRRARPIRKKKRR